MIKITYELYVNDFTRKIKEEIFYDLEEMHKWILSNSYKPNKDSFYKIFYPYGEFKDRISFQTIKLSFINSKCSCWIHQIESEKGIEYTDGKFTEGKKHKSTNINKLFEEWYKKDNAERSYNFVD